ncbi:MAG TPA: DUF5522 domain-containing protein [Chitinophagaceae bacterium]
MKELTEGIHYYINDDGYVVLTAQYHLEKGYCCGMGCLHCPYDYESVEEPRRSALLSKKSEKPE